MEREESWRLSSGEADADERAEGCLALVAAVVVVVVVVVAVVVGMWSGSAVVDRVESGEIRTGI